jgi:hypothetical protein
MTTPNPYTGPPDEVFERIDKRLQSLDTKVVLIGAPNPSDGSRMYWDLAGSHGGDQGIDLGPKIAGLFHTPFTQLMSAGPYQVGAVHERTDILKRDINLQVMVSNSMAPDTSFRYRMLEERWWSSWSLNQDSYLGVFTRTHGWRWLRVRLAEDPKTPFDIDPVAFGNHFMAWDMTLVAAFPYWCKRLETNTWVNKTDNGDDPPHTPWDALEDLIEQILKGLLGPLVTGLLPGVHIGEGHVIMPNRGSEPSYAKFIVSAPGRAWIEDGPDGRMIELPLLTAKDGYVLVDTDPTARTLTASTDPVDSLFFRIARNIDLLDFLLHDMLDSGLPVWRRMEGRFTTPWPARSKATIKVQHSNANGTITGIMPQRFSRAYG